RSIVPVCGDIDCALDVGVLRNFVPAIGFQCRSVVVSVRGGFSPRRAAPSRCPRRLWGNCWGQTGLRRLIRRRQVTHATALAAGSSEVGGYGRSLRARRGAQTSAPLPDAGVQERVERRFAPQRLDSVWTLPVPCWINTWTIFTVSAEEIAVILPLSSG